ncbi:MAG TPA: permease prefix domain 1-containing protein [Bryobacteraceae bacterium]|nr:permease prefix domain 1-containing protein [Bryobacteraceae bacterium]
MRTLQAWLLRITSLFQRERYREFAEEINSHLQLHIEDNVRAGMSPEEARRNALIKLGGMDSVQERYAERRGIPALETLAQDVRYGLRMLGKSWGLTIILAGTLALGIGVNTAIFSVLRWMAPSSAACASSEQSVVLAPQQKEGPKGKFSYLDLLDFRRQAGMFSGLFAYGLNISGLTVNGEASEFASSIVTGNYFSALGMKPALGRLFLPGEGEKAGEPLRVVLGYAYWQRRFGGDTGIAGEQVLIDGRPATILGVAQKGFHGSFLLSIWMATCR